MPYSANQDQFNVFSGSVISGTAQGIQFINATSAVIDATGVFTVTVPSPGAGGGSPAGGTNSVQYNAGGGNFGGSSNVFVDADGNLTIDALISGAIPTTPAAGTGTLFARRRAGRILPNWVGPSNVDFALQPHWGMDHIAILKAQGNGTTLAQFGMTITATGSVAAANVSNANFTSSLRRIDYPAPGAAGASCGVRGNAQTYWIGNIAGGGGIYAIWRFIYALGNPGGRVFCGFTTASANPSNLDPSTQQNFFGIGKNAADPNYSFMYNAASTAVKVDSGMPAANGDLLEVRVYVTPNATASIMRASIEKVSSSGTIALAEYDSTSSTNFPANNLFLNHTLYLQSTGTVGARIGLQSIYISSDW
jgi:hypothetical protein